MNKEKGRLETPRFFSKEARKRIIHLTEYTELDDNLPHPPTSENRVDKLSLFSSRTKPLLNLIHAPQLANTWKWASKKITGLPWIKSNSVFEMSDGQIWLMYAIFISLPPPQLLSRDESDWESRTLKALRSLSGLMTNIPTRYEYLQSQLDLYCVELCEKVWLGLLEGEEAFTFSDGLENIATLPHKPTDALIQHIITNSSITDLKLLLLHFEKLITTRPDRTKMFWSTRREGDAGLRAYFVRALTCLLLLKTGHPKRDHVLEIANTLYPKLEMTNAQLIGLTRDISTEPEKFLNYFPDLDNERLLFFSHLTTP